jgi:hypothetical protein
MLLVAIILLSVYPTVLFAYNYVEQNIISKAVTF